MFDLFHCLWISLFWGIVISFLGIILPCFFHIPCHSALEFSHLLRWESLAFILRVFLNWAGISWGLSPLYHSHTDEKTIHKSSNTKWKHIQKHIRSQLRPTSMPTVITEKNRIKQKQTKKNSKKIMYSKAYNSWLIISKQK